MPVGFLAGDEPVGAHVAEPSRDPSGEDVDPVELLVPGAPRRARAPPCSSRRRLGLVRGRSSSSSARVRSSREAARRRARRRVGVDEDERCPSLHRAPERTRSDQLDRRQDDHARGSVADDDLDDHRRFAGGSGARSGGGATSLAGEGPSSNDDVVIPWLRHHGRSPAAASSSTAFNPPMISPSR